jgi:hypothetical protein
MSDTSADRRKTTKIWMFAGWSSRSSAGSAATELWQYVYTHDNHANNDSKLEEPGEWTLVTAEASTQPQPLFTCMSSAQRVTQKTVRSDVQKVDMICPEARRDAGSWPSPNGAPGVAQRHTNFFETSVAGSI